MKLKSISVTILAITALLGGPAFAKKKPATGSTEGHKHRFETLDADKDGKLTQTEAGKRWKRIVEADTNKDGGITKEEAKAFHKARKAAKPAKAAEATS